MTRELTRRVSRLESHLPPNAKRRRFFLWMEPYEDWESIKAKAREKGYVEGDEVIVISWQTEEEHSCLGQ
jgi:hypothetical protein